MEGVPVEDGMAWMGGGVRSWAAGSPGPRGGVVVVVRSHGGCRCKLTSIGVIANLIPLVKNLVLVNYDRKKEKK